MFVEVNTDGVIGKFGMPFVLSVVEICDKMLLQCIKAELMTEHKLLNSVFRVLYILLSNAQLLGQYTGSVWQPGLLTAAVQKSSERATKYSSVSVESDGTARWIVLDGKLNPAWTDAVNCLLTQPYTYYTLNSEITTLHGQHHVIL